MEASSSKIWFLCTKSATASSWFLVPSASFSTKTPKTMGASIPAILLHTPMMLIRFAALSIGPKILMYGLLAVCKIDSPVPCTKSPPRKSPKLLVFAAGIKIKDPSAMMPSPSAIPLLKPVRLRI